VLRQPRLLVYIDLVQDIDVLLPVLLRARTQPGLSLRIKVARWLETAAPRVSALLRQHGLAFTTIPRRRVTAGEGPSLWGIDGLLTASESDQEAHRAGHALTLRARRQGLPTFTLQHGIDSLAPPEAPQIAFASETILSWFTAGQAPDSVNASKRARLVPVGRPVLAGATVEPRYDIGLFENLHAARYTEDQRAEFFDRALALIRSRPDLLFHVRPHPAGPGQGWIDRGVGDMPNVTLVTPAEAVRNTLSGTAAVATARRIITTPSTVALDAAGSGRPVALAFDGGPLYSGLPVLRSAANWLDFTAEPDTTPSEDFLARFRVDPDPAGLVVDRLMTILARPR
jgi:hypothetical protein